MGAKLQTISAEIGERDKWQRIIQDFVLLFASLQQKLHHPIDIRAVSHSDLGGLQDARIG